MTHFQPGIPAPVPNHSRYIELGLVPGQDPVPALQKLASLNVSPDLVIGIGPGLVQKTGHKINGLHPFKAQSGPGCEIPSTQASLWCWLRGDDRGEIAHAARNLLRILRPAFRIDRILDGFKYRNSLDLSGYEDGIENPKDEAAISAAFVENKASELYGSSFVAVQQWVHDLDYFDSLPADSRDNIFGRRASDSEEIDDAPLFAHVKRTAQETFEPEAFVLRRSMPWAEGGREGLVFVAFGNSFDAFEVLQNRMIGKEDGITDGLFEFTRPVTGSNFWCPPVKNGYLDLSAIGI